MSFPAVRPQRPTWLLLTLLFLGAGALSAQDPPAFTLPAWETAGSFAPLPHPREVFGFEPGADGRLARFPQIVEYFRTLAEASDRVHVEEIGTSVLGRPLIVAAISSAENIASLDDIRETAEALARGRIPEAQARARAAEGKAVVWIDGGLHATEVAGAQHTPLLAYRVAAEESEEMARIRRDVVLLLMPVMNPDGLEIVADWAEASRGTEWAGSSPPVLYHHYAGHDNNRDWFMITQPETRAVARVLYNSWYPQIVYNQHQTAPWPARIFLPPFADPVNPNIPPLVVRGVNTVGAAMARRFSREGKPGAISRVSFDMWWNGGMRTAPYFHNMVGILTETAHANIQPSYTDPASLPDFIQGTIPSRQPSVFYPDPWPGGWFRFRDAVEYMITGAVAVLDVAAAHREDWLFDIWHMGRDAVEAGAEGPYAYVIPPDQRNPGEAAELANVLLRGGLEVHRALEAFTAGGEMVPAGSYVVLAGQAFRPHLMDLMEPQVYPDMRLYPGGPPDTPYDVSGWTLPIQMGVHVARVETPFDAPLQVVAEATPWPGSAAGTAEAGETGAAGTGPWRLAARSNAAEVAVNRLLAGGASVALDAGEAVYIVRDADPADVVALAGDLGVSFDAGGGSGVTVELPRVGIYTSWRANSDEGWTRWVLENYGFPVDTLRDAHIRTGDLSRYHAIIIPDQGAATILRGYAPGSRPEAMTGGLGDEGLVRLREYVEGGGRLIAFDEATGLFMEEWDLPVRNVVDGLPREEFFVPGTLIRTRVDTTHALAYGMPGEVAASFVRSGAFEATGDGVELVARYAPDDLLLSGWALGEDRLANRGAMALIPMGRGDVVLFAFRPQFRGQPRGTFKLLFNALHEAAAE